MNTHLKLKLLIGFVIINSFMSAQNIDKAFQFYYQKEYKTSIELFKRVIAKKKNILESKYGLALIYSNLDYDKHNYSRAYKYILSVEKAFEKIDEKEKSNLLEYKINEQSISDLKNNILDLAFVETIKINTIENYDEFIRSYNDAELRNKAISSRNSLAFDLYKNQNSRQALSDFIKLYPDAKQTDSARILLKNFGLKAFYEYTFEGELDLIETFEKLYPDFEDKEKLNNEKILAFNAFRLELDKPYNILLHDAYVHYIIIAAPRELAYVALQRIISPSLIDNNWKNAIDTLNKYKIYFNNDKRIDKILNILADSDKKLKAQSISENINSTAHEYAPVITFDNKTIYFCGRNREKNIGGEDIFVSKFINGQWSEPELINGVNTPYAHEAPLAISADGNTLIIYYDKDIYYSDKIQPGWTQPRKFPSINIDYSWEADAMLSSNGKAILFISDRKDNIGQHHVFGQLFHGSHKGNLDIYVSTKTEDGWSEPINLGEKINTPYGERSPFLHPDMKTLYFSSEGHAGLGNLDVFKSTRLNDTSWIEWSEPVNLGKELNSYGDEYDYKISTYGQFAFFSSYKDENFDIQKMEIPTSMQPDKIVLISGNIKNTIGEPVKATVKWEDLKTGKIMGFSESDLTDDGKFLVILPQGKNYGYFIEHKNYYPLSGNIDLTEQKDQAEIIQNFTLISYVEIINNQHIIPLKNVFFNHNQSKLKAESYSELNRLILFIKKNHDLKIEISGHTDNSGTSNYNMKLSQKRAEAVLQYLVKNGCKSSNLVAKGYGETKPVDDNETDEGKSKNRRVEFKVLK